MIPINTLEKKEKPNIPFEWIDYEYIRQRQMGRVKWFNSKLGYGFITHCDSSGLTHDVFVHWSNLVLSDKEFHTLYKGESVEFELEECICTSNDIGTQACKVTGPNNGQLLTSLHGDTSSNTHLGNKFSHVYQVRQLSLSEFTSNDNYSLKSLQYYNSCGTHP
tara:strand:+ start:9862 stop:10350 length:489 start_codon:yes stop_codon:yes gene_type:complete